MRATASKQEFRQGEHICALFETEVEQVTMAAEYLADGLRRGERAFYVGRSADALDRFRDALRACGIDVDAMIESGALAQATNAEAHLVDGCFDSERMMSMLNEAVESALIDGFTGFRTCGDMSWLLTNAPGAEHVMAYESMLNEFFHRLGACGMCQYDKRRFSEQVIQQALATHASTMVDGRPAVNPHYIPDYGRSGGALDAISR
jgi:hypothetical protein